MKKQTLKKNGIKGITLIALVITIIVLLILAGVSIATLIGENSLLVKANNAKEEWRTSQIEEKGKLLKQEASLLEKNSNSTNEMVAYYIDEVPIPKGFSYVEGTKETYIVIKNKTDGNEFVWIPATKQEIEEKNKNNLLCNNEKYPEINSMLESIDLYDGYYIARYTAGANVEIKTSTQTEKVYSKPNMYKYKCTSLKRMMDLSMSMYPNNETNETGVISNYPLFGMDAEKADKMGWLIENKQEIKELNGSVTSSLVQDSILVYWVGHIKYEENKWSGYFKGMDVKDEVTMAAKTIFNISDDVSFRPVLYLKTN